MCRKPYFNDGIPYGCGQCTPCRINRARQWTTRMTLESYAHPYSAFITLTYENEHLPMTPNGPTLEPKDLQLFMKKLRKAWPEKLRFYAVGEYGDQTFRPHYHIALFGYPHCDHVLHSNGRARNCNCPPCRTLAKYWKHGIITNGSLTPQSASYVVGYITKKMTKPDDERLNGRHPEFARMSNRPGIGVPGLIGLIDWLKNTKNGKFFIEQTGDVPREIVIGKKSLPLGRYLTDQLRKAVGLDEGCPEFILEELKKQTECEVSEFLKGYTVKAGVYGSAVSIMDNQKVLNSQKRRSIFTSRRSL